jgi:hypothetical protein
VIIGAIFLFVCYLRVRSGDFTAEKHVGFEAAAWYWHFVDVVWLFLFAASISGRCEARAARPWPGPLGRDMRLIGRADLRAWRGGHPDLAGLWQVQRLAWKQGVLAEIEARLGAAPAPLPAAPDPSRQLPPVTVGCGFGRESCSC